MLGSGISRQCYSRAVYWKSEPRIVPIPGKANKWLGDVADSPSAGRAARALQYCKRFNAVGFASSSEGALQRSRPCKFCRPTPWSRVSCGAHGSRPFLERQWRVNVRESANDIENKYKDLPYLVYWFDQHHEDDKESRITLVPPNEIISYEEGVRWCSSGRGSHSGAKPTAAPSASSASTSHRKWKACVVYLYRVV